MPSLKELKNRIASVKSTRKITSAMKMVAASKLRRAQESAEEARPYAERMARMMASLCSNIVVTESSPRLLAGTGQNDVIMLLVVTSDRGLCGGFNGFIVRETRKLIRSYESEGKTVKLICVGRKGRDLLRREHATKIVASFDDLGRKRVGFADANDISMTLNKMFEAGEFDVCRMVFNKFKSALTQIVTVKQIVPVAMDADIVANENDPATIKPVYDYEPDEETILAELLPRSLAMQVYGALLESAAGEQGARMTAMDNATRNAGEMINKLTLNYNRSRQAYITKELIEIISGAEAV
jgi:F-type H+-transporting ATPase subunit gamma